MIVEHVTNAFDLNQTEMWKAHRECVAVSSDDRGAMIWLMSMELDAVLVDCLLTCWDWCKVVYLEEWHLLLVSNWWIDWRRTWITRGCGDAWYWLMLWYRMMNNIEVQVYQEWCCTSKSLSKSWRQFSVQCIIQGLTVLQLEVYTKVMEVYNLIPMMDCWKLLSTCCLPDGWMIAGMKQADAALHCMAIEVRWRLVNEWWMVQHIVSRSVRQSGPPRMPVA